MFALKFQNETLLMLDTEAMEPGELNALKHLADYSNWALKRYPKDTLPPVKRDPLDDIADEIVRTSKKSHSGFSDSILDQAHRRVAARNDK